MNPKSHFPVIQVMLKKNSAALKCRQEKYRALNMGFSLLDLVAAIAIVGILASMAIPTYYEYQQRVYRADAITALSLIKASQARNKAETGVYTSASLGSPEGLYSVEVTASSDGQMFKATATPVTGLAQENDKSCHTFVIDQSGAKTVLDGAGGENTDYCWRGDE